MFDGIAIVGGSANSVRSNRITDSDTSAVFIIGDNNSVSSNRIQDTPVGFWDYSGTGNTYPTGGGSSFFNVGTLTLTGLPLARRAFAPADPLRVRTLVRP